MCLVEQQDLRNLLSAIWLVYWTSIMKRSSKHPYICKIVAVNYRCSRQGISRYCSTAYQVLYLLLLITRQIKPLLLLLRLQSCKIAKLQSCKVAKLQSCKKVFSLQTKNKATRHKTHTKWHRHFLSCLSQLKTFN